MVIGGPFTSLVFHEFIYCLILIAPLDFSQGFPMYELRIDRI